MMKKMLIGLLFVWIIIFTFIGYSQNTDKQINENTEKTEDGFFIQQEQ